jgi:Secretion system C-terminal sorting domain
MKKILLLSSALLSLIATSNAQSSKTYAITSQGAGNYFWGNIREIDIQTGKILNTVFETDKTPYQNFDAQTKKELTAPDAKGLNISSTDKPFAYGVAASAFDRKHNRLYFSPMHTAQIRYIDLNSNTAKFYFLQDKMIDNPSGYLSEENHLTRMVLIDKVGYAISNDGNHLFQFTTSKKATVTDLGSLIDDPSNGGISIHNKCTSWGGDIVATNEGLLYLVTANRHVFTIDVASKIAKYVGAIKGIPAQYTTNGAVVNDAGKVVLTSANAAAGFYALDVKTLDATAIEATASNVSISDLANANLIETKKPTQFSNIEERKVNEQLVKNDNISTFPNPTATSRFKINFDEMVNGNYVVMVTDLMGRQVYTKRVVIQNESQIETIDMQKKPSAGVYLVKVTDANNKAVYVNKLIVE